VKYWLKSSRENTLKKILILTLVILSSCTWFKKKTERVVARVQDDYLYESDLTGVIPRGTIPKDSTILVRNYIENGTRKNRAPRRAENNRPGGKMVFSKQPENYRTSLFIFQ